LNRRHMDFQSIALPTELPENGSFSRFLILLVAFLVAPPVIKKPVTLIQELPFPIARNGLCSNFLLWECLNDLCYISRYNYQTEKVKQLFEYGRQPINIIIPSFLRVQVFRKFQHPDISVVIILKGDTITSIRKLQRTTWTQPEEI
jgi:hypothetical protein